MSPFSHLLHDLRMRHKIRQAELATLMGYEQRFISALEVGVKTPPADFVERLLETLQLSTGEREELAKAVSSSQRKLVIDTDSRTDIYLLLDDLRAEITSLGPRRVHLIRDILRSPDPGEAAPSEPVRRLRRRDAANQSEDARFTGAQQP
jgi:transcriptional regulator with XRE-family HTH domain